MCTAVRRAFPCRLPYSLSVQLAVPYTNVLPTPQVGVMLGLAIYNGVILPLHFPQVGHVY